MIRLAEKRDINDIVDILVAFQAEAGTYQHIIPCRESLSLFVDTVICSPRGDIAVYEKDGVIAGAICMLAFPSWYNNAVMVGQEQFWFIKPEYRGSYAIFKRLFKWACGWADCKNLSGVTFSSTSAIKAEKLEDFYARQGFVKTDILFRRDGKNG